MAADLTLKDSNSDTPSVSDPHITGPLSWTAGSRGLAFVGAAHASGAMPNNVVNVTGGSVTWNRIGFIDHGTRRGTSVFLSDGTPSAGAITINYEDGSTGQPLQEFCFAICELTGFEPTGIHDAVLGKNATTGTSISVDDLGTIDTGDLSVMVSGFEDAADSFAVQAGTTQVAKIVGGGNFRSLIVGKSTTDDTPGTQWNTSGNSVSVLGFIVNAAGQQGVPNLPRTVVAELVRPFNMSRGRM